MFSTLAPPGRAPVMNTRGPMASSSAHQPVRFGEYLDLALDVAESAGFRPGLDRSDLWRR